MAKNVFLKDKAVDLRRAFEGGEMTLRQFLWDNFGFDIYDWEENDIRF
jgi:hypothetical protein